MPHRKADIEKMLAANLTVTGAGFAAIMGNIEVATEGTFNALHSRGHGKGYGLFGMNEDMAHDFQLWLEENKSHNSPKAQIEYLRVVIDEGRFIGEKRAAQLRDGLNSGDTGHATKVFCTIIEGASTDLQQRLKAAESHEKSG
jgi:hypothetical protein